MKRKKICIIGAGIGGLTAGALLTRNGYSVTIFEKESFIGGRALSFEGSSLTLKTYIDILSRFNMNVPFSEPELKKIFDNNMLDGYILDLGYHAIGGGVLSNINNLLNKFGDHVDILESYVGLINMEGYKFPFLSKIDKIMIFPSILRLLFASERTLKRLDSVSITETIKRYGRGKMKLILEIFSRSITTINNLDLISTGEMFRSQKNLYRGSKPVGYPKKGLATVNEKLAKYINKNGGEIYLNKPVKKIIIKNNTATGVLVGNKEYFFNSIVSNILVQDLFKIADENHFPEGYVNEIKSLKGTGSLCAYYALKKINPELIGKTFHFIERNVGIDGNDAVGMIDFMSADPDSGLAPPGDFLVQSYIICTPKEARDIKLLSMLKEVLDNNLKYIMPDFHSNLKWAIYPAIWHLDGVAKMIDLKKPDVVTPVNNLFLIGDCVKATGIGVNCAIASANKVNDILS
jgi:hypothetical protein